MPRDGIEYDTACSNSSAFDSVYSTSEDDVDVRVTDGEHTDETILRGMNNREAYSSITRYIEGLLVQKPFTMSYERSMFSGMQGTLHTAEEPCEVKCRGCGCHLLVGKAYHGQNRAVPHTTRGGTTEYYCLECYDRLFHSCDMCSSVGKRDNMFQYHNGYICKKCFDRHFQKCARCDGVTEKRNLCRTEDDDTMYCGRCFKALHHGCSECGRTHRLGELTKVKDRYYCESCLPTVVNLDCPRCGRHGLNKVDMKTTDGHGTDGVPIRHLVCRKCYRDMTKVVNFHNYAYKPEPLFDPPMTEENFGKVLYMGWEGEFDRGGHDDERCAKIVDIIGRDRAYLKSDATIARGVEIVSHPFSLERYMSGDIPFVKLFKWLDDHDYVADSVDNCGMHVHINNTYLGHGDAEIECGKLKIILFFERFWKQIIVFSRRKVDHNGNPIHGVPPEYHYNAHSPCNKFLPHDYVVGKEFMWDLYNNDIKGRADRHVAVNVLNEDTVELRIFKGTLEYDIFIATLQWVQVMVDFLKQTDVEDIQSMSWDVFTKYCKGKYEVLDNYMESVGLY